MLRRRTCEEAVNLCLIGLKWYSANAQTVIWLGAARSEFVRVRQGGWPGHCRVQICLAAQGDLDPAGTDMLAVLVHNSPQFQLCQLSYTWTAALQFIRYNENESRHQPTLRNPCVSYCDHTTPQHAVTHISRLSQVRTFSVARRASASESKMT